MRTPTPSPEALAAFTEQRAAIQTLLTRSTRDEIATRYQVGLRILHVTRNPAIFGEDSLTRLATALGISPVTLRQYSAVAETWPGQDVQRLLARVAPSGDPLSWSHLVLLSRAPTDALRRQLTELCVTESWSARELRLHMQMLAGDGVAGIATTDDPEEAIGAALSMGIENAVRSSAQMSEFLAALEEHLGEEGGESPLLPRAMAALEELRARVDEAIDSMLHATRASEMRVRVATPEPGDALEDVERHLKRSISALTKTQR